MMLAPWRCGGRGDSLVVGSASSEAGEPDLSMSSCVAQTPCNPILDRVGCLRGGLKHSSCPGTHNRLERVRVGLVNLFLPLLLGRKHRRVPSHPSAASRPLVPPPESSCPATRICGATRGHLAWRPTAPHHNARTGDTGLCTILANAGVHGATGEVLADGLPRRDVVGRR